MKQSKYTRPVVYVCPPHTRRAIDYLKRHGLFIGQRFGYMNAEHYADIVARHFWGDTDAENELRERGLLPILASEAR